MVGAPGSNAFGSTLVHLVGTISTIYGSPQIDPRVAGNRDNAIPITNRTITGSGDFLVEGDPGQPFVQPGALPPGTREIWYRFTTLGAGEAGNQIVLTPAFEGARTALLRGEDGRVSSLGQVQISNLLSLGAEANDAVVIEFDLSGYLDRMQDLSSIQRAILTLDTSLTFSRFQSAFGLTYVNNLLFFSGQDRFVGPATGTLWKSDGTVLGTNLVRASGLSSLFDPQNLTNVNGTLFFSASQNPGGGNVTLWKYDPTTGQAVIVPGAGSFASLANFTNANGSLFFTTNFGDLFRTDGTSVIQVGSFRNAGNLKNVNGTVFFTNNATLWRTDGTNVFQIASFNSIPANLTNVGGTLYFAADDGTNGMELWKSNGSTATRARDIVVGIGSSSPLNLVNLNGILYFTADDGTHGREVWRSDGTTAGTTRLAGVNASFGPLSAPGQLTAAGNTLYFSARESTTGIELWSYDTALNSLKRLTDIVAGPGTSDPEELTVRGTTLFFTVDTGTGRRELWKSDGTPATTVPVSNNGGAGFQSVDPRSGRLNLTTNGSAVAFTELNPAGDVEIWTSDGTSPGTRSLNDSGLMDRTLQVLALDAEGDGAVTAFDRTAAAASSAAPTLLRNVKGSAPLTIDVTGLVRAALQAGSTRLTLRLQLDASNASSPLVLHSSTDPLRATGLNITTVARQGAVADVFDSEGRRLAEGRSIIDMRSFDAGTYFVRVYNPAGIQPSPMSFSLAITAPKPGAFHALSDHDLIHGSDGNDIVIGNDHLDRLFGDRGNDAFIAEDVEVRDLETAEFRQDSLQEERIVASQVTLKPLNPSIDSYVHEEALRLALARALDIPVTLSYRGVPFAREPIRAAQMATLTRLDLNGLHLADVSGVEFATNLRALSLSGNEVVDLAILASHTLTEGQAGRTPIGLTKLEYLALDFTQIANPARLSEFTNLKAVSADGRPAYQVTLPGSVLGNTLLRQIANPTTTGIGERFSQALAIFGNFALIGAPLTDVASIADAGLAYLFDLTSGQLLRTIGNPFSTVGNDQFGFSVALSNSLMAIGAPLRDDGATQDAGAVYVYDLVTGALLATLQKPGTRAAGDQFGYSVAIWNDLIAVGAPFHDEPSAADAGAVYLFDGRTGALVGTFKKTAPVAGDQFGSSVALSGTQLLVGVPFDDTTATNAGAAWIFDLASGKGAALPNPPLSASANFGNSVSLSANRALIGAPGQLAGGVAVGAAYLFDTPGSPQLLSTLVNPKRAAGDQFGWAVALEGDAVIVGSPLDDTISSNDGAVYVFDAASGSLLRTLYDPRSNSIDQFGWAVASSGGTLLAGAILDGILLAGAAYSHEGLRLIDPAPFGSLSQLQFLSLSNNHLDSVAPFSNLNQLQLLFLDNNR
ncbi:MAG: hypothetical protein DMG78_20985, partial [Acidobacteria bacterium]